MKILIVRHGEPNYEIDSLTEKGFREAEYLAERLGNLKDADFYCSPLGRAKDTAAPTLKKIKKEAEILPWLTEFEGKIKFPSSEERVIPWNLDPQYWTKEESLYHKDQWLSHSLMKSDTVEQVYNETIEGLDTLLKKYGYTKYGNMYKCDDNKDNTIVIFCHFALAMTMLSYLLGVSAPVLWQNFLLPASSVTTLITEERRKGEIVFRCMQLGDTSHLYANGEPVSKAGLYYEIYDKNNPDGTQI